MKYQCLNKETILYGDIPITVKELVIAGHPQERYFIYDKFKLPTCGGAGWKDLEKMLNYYEWWKRQPDKKEMGNPFFD